MTFSTKVRGEDASCFVVHLSESHERVECQIWRNVSRCETAIAPIKNGPKETESSLCPLSKHVAAEEEKPNLNLIYANKFKFKAKTIQKKR